MDPKFVKLPLKIRVKTFFEVLNSDQENWFAIIAISILVIISLGMALCVPSFMVGPISQFFVTIILAFGFGASFIGIGIVVGEFYRDQFEPWYSVIMDKYNKKTLPIKKQKLEEVDDILLK